MTQDKNLKLWIAREKCGHLYLHKGEPYHEEGMWYNRYCVYMKLPTKDFPEVTFENSPMEVELILKQAGSSREE